VLLDSPREKGGRQVVVGSSSLEAAAVATPVAALMQVQMPVAAQKHHWRHANVGAAQTSKAGLHHRST